MLNDHVLSRFAPLGSRLMKPIYDGYSFACIPATLEKLLTGAASGALLPPDCFGGSYPAPERVVLVFVDSFGWEFWQRYGERSRLMRDVIGGGVLTPISALFPSTTAASVTTLNFGCLPAEHAVYEWNLYVPAFGETIQSLAFRTLGRHGVPCKSKGFDIRAMVLGGETLHRRLARQGVRSIQLAHKDYAFSPYNTLASAGATVIPHGSLPEAVGQLREAIRTVPGKALIQFYWAGLDTIAHIAGPGTPQHEAAVLEFWQTLDTALDGIKSPGTLVLFTADHGHVGCRAEDTIYVNERWPELNGWLAQSPTGQTIWPNGSPRDMFLHIAEPYRRQAMATLSRGLDGVAEILAVDDALAAGLFGSVTISPELRRRLGDILVLPYLGSFVWWHEPGIMANRFHGHHGGLSREEMTTVLGAVQL